MAMILDGTAGLTLPTWTTAGRPTSPQNGQMGYNSSTSSIEAYMLGNWITIASGTYAATYLAVAGGGGGGGAGARGSPATTPTAGTVNTGGGGGGGRGYSGPGGAAGGSGIVIIRYQSTFQRGSGGTITTSGGYYYHTFTSSGTYTA